MFGRCAWFAKYSTVCFCMCMTTQVTGFNVHRCIVGNSPRCDGWKWSLWWCWWAGMYTLPPGNRKPQIRKHKCTWECKSTCAGNCVCICEWIRKHPFPIVVPRNELWISFSGIVWMLLCCDQLLWSWSAGILAVYHLAHPRVWMDGCLKDFKS